MRTRTKPLGRKNAIGAKIVALRAKEGLNQMDLLARLHLEEIQIGITALSEIEGQHRRVTVEEVKALAKIFKIDVTELL